GAPRPAAGAERRQGGARDAVMAAKRRKEAQERAEPYRPATRHDRITEDGDDDRPGARRLGAKVAQDLAQRRTRDHGGPLDGRATRTVLAVAGLGIGEGQAHRLGARTAARMDHSLP